MQTCKHANNENIFRLTKTHVTNVVRHVFADSAANSNPWIAVRWCLVVMMVSWRAQRAATFAKLAARPPRMVDSTVPPLLSPYFATEPKLVFCQHDAKRVCWTLFPMFIQAQRSLVGATPSRLKRWAPQALAILSPLISSSVSCVSMSSVPRSTSMCAACDARQKVIFRKRASVG